MRQLLKYYQKQVKILNLNYQIFMYNTSSKKLHASVPKKTPFIRPKSLAYRQNPVEVYCRLKPIDQNQQQSIQLIKEDNTIEITESGKFKKYFSFDKIFDEDVSQEQLVEKICAPILERYNQRGKGSLIFTYGVTNSGKTHTILGTMQNPGILPYLIKNLKSEEQIEIQAIQIYNDQFFSLKNKEKLTPKETSGYIFFSEDISEIINEQNMDNILSKYMNNRSQNSTKINPKSSRSHAIFRILIDGVVIGVVDLAGSERINKTGLTTIEESSSINKSLLSLGRCIQALKQQAFNSSIQIPYRQSKLTKYLMEFFSPDYKNYLIVNINQSKNLLHENLKVLEYAALAKQIKHTQNLSNSIKSIKKQKYEDVKSQELPSIQKQQNLGVKALCNSVVRVHHWRQCQMQKQKAEEQYLQQINRLKKQIQLMCRRQKIQKILARLQSSQQQFEYFFDSTFLKQRQETQKMLQQIRQYSSNTPVKNDEKTFVCTSMNTDQYMNQQQMKQLKAKLIKEYKQQLEKIQLEEKRQKQATPTPSATVSEPVQIQTPAKQKMDIQIKDKSLYETLSGPLNFMKSSAKKIYQGTTSLIQLVAKSRKKQQSSKKSTTKKLSLASFDIYHGILMIGFRKQIGIQASIQSEQIEIQTQQQFREIKVPQTQQFGTDTQYEVSVIEEQQQHNLINQKHNISQSETIDQTTKLAQKKQKKQAIVKKRTRKQRVVYKVSVTPIKCRLRSKK